MKYKLTRFFNILAGFFPTPLPVGLSEFNAWADSFATTYSLPTADQDSIRYALATMIMHQGPTAAYKSKFFFYLCLRSSAAKQVAGAAFMEIKTKQQAAQAAAQATPVVSDVQTG
jgi:hypothetical protein